MANQQQLLVVASTHCESSRPGAPRVGISEQPAQLSATSTPLRSEVVGLESYMSQAPIKFAYHPVALVNTGAENNTVVSLTTTLQVKREGDSFTQYGNARMSFGPRICTGFACTMNVTSKPGGIGQTYDPVATATVMSSALVKTLRSLFGGCNLPAAPGGALTHWSAGRADSAVRARLNMI
eukprot:5394888-Amphidinium_carterae.1